VFGRNASHFSSAPPPTWWTLPPRAHTGWRQRLQACQQGQKCQEWRVRPAAARWRQMPAECTRTTRGDWDSGSVARLRARGRGTTPPRARTAMNRQASLVAAWHRPTRVNVRLRSQALVRESRPNGTWAGSWGGRWCTQPSRSGGNWSQGRRESPDSRP